MMITSIIKKSLIILFIIFFVTGSVRSEDIRKSYFYYPKQQKKKNPAKLPDTVIGEIKVYKVKKRDTLLDIARFFNLGFSELKDCNRGVDQWVPPEGEILIIPTQWILPECNYQGMVINIPEKRLFYFLPKANSLLTFPIGLGMLDSPTPKGKYQVTGKREDPTWYVPESIRSTMEEPKNVVPPGPDNPLGKYFLALSEGYGIHGTNLPWSIGRLTTHGCIRLYPEDIEFLYKKVNIGTPVQIMYQPIKVGMQENDIYLEVHEDIYGFLKNPLEEALRLIKKWRPIGSINLDLVRSALEDKNGVPICISKHNNQ